MSSLGRVVLICGFLLATSAQATVHHAMKRALLRGQLVNHVGLNQQVGATINQLLVRHFVFATHAHRLARVGIDVLPLWDNNNRHLLRLAGHHHRYHHDSMISPLHPSRPVTGDRMISPLHPHHPHH